MIGGIHMTGSDRHSGLAGVLDDHLAAEFAIRDVDGAAAGLWVRLALVAVIVIVAGLLLGVRRRTEPARRDSARRRS